MLPLPKLAGIQMYGTCSVQGAAFVRELGGIPIDYRNADFVKEIHRLTHDGVEAVFDGSAATKPGRISNSCRKRSMWLGSMFLAR